MQTAIDKLKQGGFSIGIELPLDNDWSPVGDANRHQAGRLPGEPDMQHHAQLAKLADKLGFRALWVRDVPLYDPSFGDAAQVYEAFTYLGYLAGITSNILLGTAAVVMPLREPVLTLKSAATVARLSGDRLLLGVASGDRPVEYPIFGKDYTERGQAFRAQIEMARDWGTSSLPDGIKLIPKPAQPFPLLVAGLAQQNPQWIGQHMDGWLAYPGTPEDHVHRVAMWREVAGLTKPYISFIHLDLCEDLDEPIRRHRFGATVGRNGLIAELMAMQDAGVDHIGLHFRRNRRPLTETLQEIGEYILPVFQGSEQVLANLSA